MALAKFEGQSGPIDAITKALNVAHTVYGIKQAGSASDLAKQQLVASQQKSDQDATTFDQSQDKILSLQDPNSNESKISKQGALVALSAAKNTSAYKKDPTAFDSLIKQISDPSTTGLQANALIDSPALKAIEGNVNKDMGLQYMAAAMANRNSNTQEKTDLNANSKYQAALAPFESTLQAANRAEHIINQIQKADPNDPNSMKSTKLMRADLGNTLGSLFNQGKAATVHGAVGANQDTLFGSLGDAYTKLTGSPTNTVPAGLLNQMAVDIGSLKNSYSDAHNIAFQSMLEGLPDRIRPAMQGRFDKFRKLSGLAPGSANESMYSGGGLPGMSDASASTVAPPQKTNDIFSAAQAELAKRRAKK